MVPFGGRNVGNAVRVPVRGRACHPCGMAKPTDDAPGAATRPSRADRPAGPAPTRAKLHEAALAHLAKFSATEAGLVRVLDRRIDRWARRAAAESTEPGTELDTAPSRLAAREVARALVQSGVVDDTAFAAGRARSLTRAGRSRRAISAHLSAKGVPQEVARAALPEADTELAAALAYARRRRLGPFRTDRDTGVPIEDTRRKEIGALARAGFPQPVAQQALRMDREEAEAAVIRLKQG
jgi:regulatory protein